MNWIILRVAEWMKGALNVYTRRSLKFQKYLFPLERSKRAFSYGASAILPAFEVVWKSLLPPFPFHLMLSVFLCSIIRARLDWNVWRHQMPSEINFMTPVAIFPSFFRASQWEAWHLFQMTSNGITRFNVTESLLAIECRISHSISRILPKESWCEQELKRLLFQKLLWYGKKLRISDLLKGLLNSKKSPLPILWLFVTDL